MAQRHGDTITSPSWCISGALHHGALRGRAPPFTSNHSRHALVSPLGFCEPITIGFMCLHGMTALRDIQTSAIPGHSAEMFVLHYFGTLPCLPSLGCLLTPHDRCAPCTGLIFQRLVPTFGTSTPTSYAAFKPNPQDRAPCHAVGFPSLAYTTMRASFHNLLTSSN